MFTIKLVNNERKNNEYTLVESTAFYEVQKQIDHTHINGAEDSWEVGHDEGQYDACYISNEFGKTVDIIRKPKINHQGVSEL